MLPHHCMPQATLLSRSPKPSRAACAKSPWPSGGPAWTGLWFVFAHIGTAIASPMPSATSRPANGFASLSIPPTLSFFSHALAVGTTEPNPLSAFRESPNRAAAAAPPPRAELPAPGD